MRSAHYPGPTNDQEAQQEEFLGALKALGGSAGNGRFGSCWAGRRALTRP
jgi:hypothetical protein